MEIESLGDLARRRRIEQILFVGEHKHRDAGQLLFVQQLAELLTDSENLKQFKFLKDIMNR